MPGILGVPASNLSGKKVGIYSLSDTLPVPPLINGDSFSAKSLLIRTSPMPDGPNSPLCPGRTSALIFDL